MLATKSLKRVPRSLPRFPSNGSPSCLCSDGPSLRRNTSLLLPRGPAYSNHANCNHHTGRLCRSGMRPYSTDKPPSNPDTSGSIFSPSESPWDHVFENIPDTPPLLPSSVRRQRKQSPSTERTPPRLQMTLREISAFDEMFDWIFNTANRTDHGDNKPKSLTSILGIGNTRSHAPDLFAQMNRHSKRLKWTSEADEELDRKKEEMELCETDQQLLEWAMREVFAESERYEARARAAPLGAAVQLQPATYPHLLALLMHTFRDKYADPHLALALFGHARHLSIASFVFGCTTPAYNELLETRWRCFRDLRGVCDALEEMRANGVELDTRTRALAEMIRREVGERNLWQEESTVGSGEVWEMVARIEHLAAREPRRARDDNGGTAIRSRRWSLDQETWQGRALQGDSAKDGWEFGQWGEPEEDSRPSRNGARGSRFGLR